MALMLRLFLPCFLFAALMFSGERVARAGDIGVGEITFLIGVAHITAGPDAPHELARGAQVKVGQTIETGANGHAHIRFVDGAAVAVRPDTRLRIEEYHFDTTNPAHSKVRFSLEEGVARSITGRAGEAARDRFRLNTPLAAIGVKGTDFIVEANSALTRVSVQSGAVVMAPLGNGCIADAFGPCAVASARELSGDAHGGYLQLAVRQSIPELLPERGTASSVAAPARSAPQQDPRTLVARVAETNVASLVTETVAAASIAAPPVSTVTPPQPVFPAATASPQLWWGRWASYVDPAHPETGYEYQAAIPGREYAAGNAFLGLLRESTVTMQFPTRGQADFNLAKAEAYVMDGTQLSPASVLSGSLGIDFDAQRFNTRLAVATSGTTTLNLASRGRLEGDGRFFADRGSPMWVFGALSNQAAQAGYAFQQPLDAARTLTGATLWTR